MTDNVDELIAWHREMSGLWLFEDNPSNAALHDKTADALVKLRDERDAALAVIERARKAICHGDDRTASQAAYQVLVLEGDR